MRTGVSAALRGYHHEDAFRLRERDRHMSDFVHARALAVASEHLGGLCREFCPEAVGHLDGERPDPRLVHVADNF